MNIWFGSSLSGWKSGRKFGKIQVVLVKVGEWALQVEGCEWMGFQEGLWVDFHPGEKYPPSSPRGPASESLPANNYHN